VRTGEVTSPPASESEPTYEIKVDGNSVLVKKHPSAIEKRATTTTTTTFQAFF
jgi:hypothetical protein